MKDLKKFILIPHFLPNHKPLAIEQLERIDGEQIVYAFSIIYIKLLLLFLRKIMKHTYNFKHIEIQATEECCATMFFHIYIPAATMHDLYELR